MFEVNLKNLKDFFCTTNFKELENTFDDRHTSSGYYIKPVPGTKFEENETGHIITGTKEFKIYLQYQKENLDTLIKALQFYFKCSDGKILSLQDDSKIVFEELTETEFNARNFKFAYILIELSDFMRAENCQVC